MGGTHIESPIDPRLMVVAPEGTKGDYIFLGSEGFDTDGDGRRNNDARGGYDMNRDFPSDWQPSHVDQFYSEAWTDSAAVPDEMRQLFFNDRLGMGAWFRDWTPYDHPELGPVEIGGWSKWYGRPTPPFMLQELAHRNAMFALYHADEMPLLEWGDITTERIAGNMYRVKTEIRNTRAMPTRIEAAELYSSGVPDRFSISGSNVRVQAGGFTSGELSTEIEFQEKDPEVIRVNGGVQGRSSLSVTWIVTGSGSANVTYRSQKGGTHTQAVQLR